MTAPPVVSRVSDKPFVVPPKVQPVVSRVSPKPWVSAPVVVPPNVERVPQPGNSKLVFDLDRTRREPSSVKPRDQGKRKVVCKERPKDNTPRSGGGPKRGFIPWCR